LAFYARLFDFIHIVVVCKSCLLVAEIPARIRSY